MRRNFVMGLTEIRRSAAAAILLGLFVALPLKGQGTLADYERAHALQTQAFGMVVDTPGQAHWIGDSHHFWYTTTAKGGYNYLLADADSGTKHVAFDQARLATAISAATKQTFTALTLPFTSLPTPPGSKPKVMPPWYCTSDFPEGRAGDPVWSRRIFVYLQSDGVHLREGWPDSQGASGWP